MLQFKFSKRKKLTYAFKEIGRYPHFDLVCHRIKSSVSIADFPRPPRPALDPQHRCVCEIQLAQYCIVPDTCRRSGHVAATMGCFDPLDTLCALTSGYMLDLDACVRFGVCVCVHMCTVYWIRGWVVPPRRLRPRFWGALYSRSLAGFWGVLGLLCAGFCFGAFCWCCDLIFGIVQSF